MKRLIIGTRSSNLAMIQAKKVAAAISISCPDVDIEIKTISTKGDRVTGVPLHKVQATGVFVKELEEALIRGDVDIAVHSLKDMPSALPEGLTLSAVFEREDPRDALIRPTDSGEGALRGDEVVGTSSLRRRAQLLHTYPKLKIVDIRGNIETRLAKLDDGQCDATVLAAAGLERAGYQNRISHRFSKDEMLPAACQGIIAVEQREDAESVKEILGNINHAETYARAAAERKFLRVVEGGCRIPVGCCSWIDGSSILIDGLIAEEDGSRVIRKSAEGAVSDADAVAEQLASDILADGGREILKNYDD